MTTLVTGATGFVGSAVARKLVARGHRVRVLVRVESDRRNLEGLDAEERVGDLRDPASLVAALEGCENLFHVAAEYRLWHPVPRTIYRSNLDGTRNLLAAAKAANVQRVVYTSSVATLGVRPAGEPADEHADVSIDQMIGHYKRSKYLAEEEVKRCVREDGLPVVIVNPSAPIGPRDVKPTPTGRMVLDTAAGRTPAFVDSGLNVVHVDDVAEGHVLAFEKGRVGERYVLGGENLTLEDILGRVARIAGRKPPRIRLAPNLLLPVAWFSQGWARCFGGGREPRVTVDGLRMSKKRMFFTSAKAQAELGYEPRPAQQALQDAVAWFRSAGYLS